MHIIILRYFSTQFSYCAKHDTWQILSVIKIKVFWDMQKFNLLVPKFGI
jgi:hypothetical protein